MYRGITRRDFLRDATALGALGLTGCANFSLGADGTEAAASGTSAAAGKSFLSIPLYVILASFA